MRADRAHAAGGGAPSPRTCAWPGRSGVAAGTCAGLTRAASSVRGSIRPLAEATAPLAVVVAPAGYGKTTVLTDWRDQDRRLFGWLTLGEADNDEAHLRARLSHVLGEIGSKPSVLVLDDLHLVHDEPALELIRELSEHVAPGSVLALASRSAPPLPLGRLRSQDDVVELRAPALAMTEPEAALLFRQAGLRLPPRRSSGSSA